MFREMIEQAMVDVKGDDTRLVDLIERISDAVYGLMALREADNVAEISESDRAFVERNYARWQRGFHKLEMLRQISIEAGIAFQKQFLKHPIYHTDPLLGVLMRHHANACRITGEILVLLRCGYPDGALARWRTLFEILVTSTVLHRYGNDAAIDYIKHGKIQAVEGMKEYQKTAKDMSLEPYEEADLQAAIRYAEELSDGKQYFKWAEKYTGFGKLEKLREHVGLGKWSHNYKWASQSVHADFSEMRAMLAMAEAKQDLMLVGPSNSGLIDPAHMTAISLMQISAMFLTAHMGNSKVIDYTDSLVYMSLMDRYAEAVGREFLACAAAAPPANGK